MADDGGSTGVLSDATSDDFAGDVLAGLGNRPVALVLGAEGPGLRDKTRDTCDHLARIPFAGAFEDHGVHDVRGIDGDRPRVRRRAQPASRYRR